nr:gliding motility lipoprotein GldH [Geofilum rubicundum]
MKRKAKFQVLPALLVMAVFTFSCQSSVVFDEVFELGEQGWHKDQKAVFQVEISDTSQVLDVGMTFRHSDDYPYSNIWLFVDMEGDKGVLVKDTLEFFLSETDGRWLGKREGICTKCRPCISTPLNCRSRAAIGLRFRTACDGRCCRRLFR